MVGLPGTGAAIANAVKQSMAETAVYSAPVVGAVIANAVKQSMASNCMDCRATLAVTETFG
jgi:hypothetical protein